MNLWQAQVLAFHEATDSAVATEPTLMDEETRALRAKLIMEEAVETVAALGFDVSADIVKADSFLGEHNGSFIGRFNKAYEKPNLLDFIDGMCDLIYVIAGSAVSAGVDLAPHFDEVHDANMRKLAGPKREDGKQLKPEGWRGPDHGRIIDATKGEAQANRL